MNDEADELAMMAGAMKKQRDMTRALLSAVEGKLGALADAMGAGSVKAELGAIESALADIGAALEGKGTAAAIESLADAIRSLDQTVTVNVPEQAAPTVTVQVNPTPVTFEAIIPPAPAPVIHLMPAPEAEEKRATWEVRIPGHYGAADRVMTITRTS